MWPAESPGAPAAGRGDGDAAGRGPREERDREAGLDRDVHQPAASERATVRRGRDVTVATILKSGCRHQHLRREASAARRRSRQASSNPPPP